MINSYHHQRRTKLCCTVLLMAALLSGCGGGGGDSAGSNSDNFDPTATNNKPGAVVSSSSNSSSEETNTLSSESEQITSSSSLSATPMNSSVSSNAAISNNLSSLFSSSSKSSTTTNAINNSSSKKSASSSAYVPDTTAPTPPQVFQVISQTNNMIAFEWSPAEDNVGVIRYKIYRDQVQIDTVDAFEFNYIDYNVAPGKAYTYGISAGDSSNNWSTVKSLPAQTSNSGSGSSVSSSSSLSSISSMASSSAKSVADTTSPSAPSNLTKTLASSSEVDISWGISIDNVGVVKYEVARDGILLATINPGTLAFTDITAQANQQYTYGVRAFDAAGNSSSYATIFVTTPMETQTPATTTLKWTAPATRENMQALLAADIGGYEIRYITPTADSYTSVLVTDNNATQYVLNNIPNDATYEIACYDTKGLYSQFVAINPE